MFHYSLRYATIYLVRNHLKKEPVAFGQLTTFKNYIKKEANS